MARNELLRQRRIQHNWRQKDLASQLNVSLLTVQRWEQGVQQPSSYYRTKLCELFGTTAQELGFWEEQPPLPSESKPSEPERANTAEKAALWMVPYARNPHFTGRADLLDVLEEQFFALSSEQSATVLHLVLTQPQAIKGLGGIGKTQIAVEFA